jgi:hypothetical protein
MANDLDRAARALTDNATFEEVPNALWLQARKVGPLKGKHTASITGIIESSKDSEYRLQ